MLLKSCEMILSLSQAAGIAILQLKNNSSVLTAPMSPGRCAEDHLTINWTLREFDKLIFKVLRSTLLFSYAQTPAGWLNGRKVCCIDQQHLTYPVAHPSC